MASRELLQKCVKTFHASADVPSELASLPEVLPGVGWSDHWSFWHEGYTGVMVTDTAPFCYPHYHRATDTIDKIGFDRLANVVVGLEKVIEDLAGEIRDPDWSGFIVSIFQRRTRIVNDSPGSI